MSVIICSACPTLVRVYPSDGTDESITPSAEWSFKEGDVLRCVSDSYPEPSYTWTDGDGVVVSTASTMRLSEGVFNLTCTATGSFTTQCSASITVSGNATGKIHPVH